MIKFIKDYFEKREQARYDYLIDQQIACINSGSLMIEGSKSFRYTMKTTKSFLFFDKTEWIKVYE